jgi:hypothetical protein
VINYSTWAIAAQQQHAGDGYTGDFCSVSRTIFVRSKNIRISTVRFVAAHIKG